MESLIDQSSNPADPAPDPVGKPLPVNHVFVDYENVRSIGPAVPRGKPATVTILIGAKQRMDFQLVEQLLPHAGSVELVRLESSGRNALDFALAYYVGRKAVMDPTAFFHIVSGDKGFDPLVGHLCSRNIKAHRHDGFDTLTFSGPPEPSGAPLKDSGTQQEDSLERALSVLRKNPKNRPSSKKTLISFLRNLGGKNSTESGAQALAAVLQQKGHVKEDAKGGVAYHL